MWWPRGCGGWRRREHRWIRAGPFPAAFGWWPLERALVGRKSRPGATPLRTGRAVALHPALGLAPRQRSPMRVHGDLGRGRLNMSWWRRAYRWVLMLYPEPFRRRYGEDMEELYVESVQAARLAWWAQIRGLADSVEIGRAHV